MSAELDSFLKLSSGATKLDIGMMLRRRCQSSWS